VATFEQRDGKWRAKVRRKGFPTESATFDTKGEARSWAIQLEAEMVGRRHGKIIQRTVVQALEKFRDDVSPQHGGHQWESVRLNKLAQELPFKHRLLSEVQPVDIAAWRDAALAGTDDRKPLKPASVRREWTLLRSMFEIARKEWGWVADNPMSEVKRPPKPGDRKQKWSPDEIERVVMALGYERWNRPTTIGHHVALAFLFALETAMRQGEICGLTWEHVHLDDRFVHLPKTKNGDERDVPLSTPAAEILRIYDRLKRTETVFSLETSQVDANFRKAKTRAGIADLHFHDSRANAIELLSKKLEILDLARVVGHRDLKSLMIYYRKSVTEIAKRLD
jgi:integrase